MESNRNQENQPNLGSFLILPEIIRILSKFKISQKTLRDLRSLSQDYYTHFKSLYFDRVNKSVNIKWDYEYPQTRHHSTRQTFVETFDSVTPSSSVCREITPDYWNERVRDFAYTIRSLYLQNKWDLNTNPHLYWQGKPIIGTIISHIRPHITILSFDYNFMETHFNQNLQRFQFIYQFPNLKEIQIQPISSIVDEHETILQELSQILSQLKPTLHIKVHVPLRIGSLLIRDLDNLFTKLTQFSEGITNITILIEILKDQQLEQFQYILRTFGNILHKLKFTLDYKSCDLEDQIDDLEELAEICVSHQKYIHGIRIHLHVKKELGSFSLDHQQQLALRTNICLNKLSKFVVKLVILQEIDTKLDLLSISTSCSWSNLEEFWIKGYQCDLGILKKLYWLKELSLNVNLDNCFFHNNGQEKNEIIAEYFGSLKNLRMLVIRKDQKEIIKATHIRQILQENKLNVCYYSC